MSLTVLVQCPHCQAQGNLADPSLFGKQISCPVCQKIFTAPTPTAEASAVPATEAPADATLATPETTAASSGTESPPSPAAAEIATSLPPTTEPSITTALPDEPTSGADASATVVQPAPPSAEGVPLEQPGAVATAAPAAPVTAPMPVLAAQTIAPPVASTPPVTSMSPVVAAPPIVAPPLAGGAAWPPVGTAIPGLPAAPPPIQPFSIEGSAPPRDQHEIDGPLPSFLTPQAAPGAAEEHFASSLPEPAARGNVKPPKLPSRQTQKLIIGTVSAIVVFAMIMFLLGDPWRRFGKKPKSKEPLEDNPIARPLEDGPAESVEDVFARINAMNKSGESSDNKEKK